MQRGTCTPERIDSIWSAKAKIAQHGPEICRELFDSILGTKKTDSSSADVVVDVTYQQWLN